MKTVFSWSPLTYYRYLRINGYKARTAAICCLMRYSGSKSEFSFRANRCAVVLNRNDIARR